MPAQAAGKRTGMFLARAITAGKTRTQGVADRRLIITTVSTLLGCDLRAEIVSKAASEKGQPQTACAAQ